MQRTEADLEVKTFTSGEKTLMSAVALFLHGYQVGWRGYIKYKADSLKEKSCNKNY
jgi:hypothetical protein